MSGGAYLWEFIPALRDGSTPFWLLLGSKRFQARIEQVLVNNQSAQLASDPEYKQFHPCAIINVIDASAPEPSSVIVNGVLYQSDWSDTTVAVYLPAGSQG